MTSPEPAVTVIIPTRGLPERRDHLYRAIASVRRQEGVRATPLVVINGSQSAPEVSATLLAHSDVHVLTRPVAHLPSALRLGREAVDTPWFGTLDDDDELLPDALSRRIAALRRNPDADVVVSNGYRRVNGHDVLHIAGDHRIAVDPLRAFHRGNWLLPGSWTARSDRVDATLFDGMPSHRECTFLALRFSTQYNMIWLDEPTVVYHEGSPRAVSRSYAYMVGQLKATRSLLRLPLPGHMQRRVRWEVAAALHDTADRCWADGDLANAWRHHGASLRAWLGLRYLPFTRHLLVAEWRRLLQRLRDGTR
jgi:glycosyltransferase involved in cell wall biosynthesis